MISLQKMYLSIFLIKNMDKCVYGMEEKIKMYYIQSLLGPFVDQQFAFGSANRESIMVVLPFHLD